MEAVDMVDGIRSQFNTLLDEIDWMDPATKRKARVKASRMTEHIGFPSELLNMGLLTHHYSKQRPQTMRLRMLTGSHSPGKVRVMATLSNMEEFAKFSVPCWIQNEPTKE